MGKVSSAGMGVTGTLSAHTSVESHAGSALTLQSIGQSINFQLAKEVDSMSLGASGLMVTSGLSVNGDRFTVSASDGNSYMAGMLQLNKNTKQHGSDTGVSRTVTGTTGQVQFLFATAMADGDGRDYEVINTNIGTSGTEIIFT